VIELASGACAGAEALIRWRHPERGLVPPDLFIALAEDTGRIVPITRWLMGRIAEEMGERLRGDPGFHVAINLAPAHFETLEVVEDVRAVVQSGVGDGDTVRAGLGRSELTGGYVAIVLIGAHETEGWAEHDFVRAVQERLEGNTYMGGRNVYQISLGPEPDGRWLLYLDVPTDLADRAARLAGSLLEQARERLLHLLENEGGGPEVIH